MNVTVFRTTRPQGLILAVFPISARRENRPADLARDSDSATRHAKAGRPRHPGAGYVMALSLLNSLATPRCAESISRKISRAISRRHYRKRQGCEPVASWFLNTVDRSFCRHLSNQNGHTNLDLIAPRRRDEMCPAERRQEIGRGASLLVRLITLNRKTQLSPCRLRSRLSVPQSREANRWRGRDTRWIVQRVAGAGRGGRRVGSLQCCRARNA